ncbi:MAG: hypothetical protein HWE16_10235 [Gammaproteobacteria bacterium]|nr:hypothetical protein [Gammaproteobacteria bacterium]
MAKFKVLGGDFKAGRGRFTMRSFSLPSFNLKAYFETVSLKDVAHINRATPEMVELILKDPINIENENSNEMTFITTLHDKRRFVGVTDKDVFFKVVESHRNMKNQRTTRGAVATTS